MNKLFASGLAVLAAATMTACGPADKATDQVAAPSPTPSPAATTPAATTPAATTVDADLNGGAKIALSDQGMIATWTGEADQTAATAGIRKAYKTCTGEELHLYPVKLDNAAQAAVEDGVFRMYAVSADGEQMEDTTFDLYGEISDGCDFPNSSDHDDEMTTVVDFDNKNTSTMLPGAKGVTYVTFPRPIKATDTMFVMFHTGTTVEMTN